MNAKLIIDILRTFDVKHFHVYSEKIKRHLLKHPKSIIFQIPGREYIPEDAIVIFSEARSGSTFLMEAMKNALGAATIFEPLWGKEGMFKKIANLYSSPFYFGEDESAESLVWFLRETFKGKQTSGRTLQYNTFRELSNKTSLVVKLNNVNLIAPWFIENFSLKSKPIYLLRHPLAILSSRGNYGYNKVVVEKKAGRINTGRWKSDLHPYWVHLNYLTSLSTHYERNIAEWCIRNQLVMQSSNCINNLNVVFYEDLISDPVQSFESLLQNIHLPSNLSRINSKTTSKTANVGEDVSNINWQLEKWKRTFDRTQLNRLQKILDHFEITYYNVHEVMPVKNKLSSS